MATGDPPKRILSAAQEAEMLRKEKVVLEHRARGWSFHRIEREFKIHNPDRVWRRAVARDENAGFLRAENVRLEEQRLDALQDGIWDKALGGDTRAVEVALKVLERRARMHGLDFADMVSGQLVEVERAKVRLMATALVAALDAIGATPEQRRVATERFLAELRSLQGDPAQAALPAAAPPALAPEDEGLL